MNGNKKYSSISLSTVSNVKNSTFLNGHQLVVVLGLRILTLTVVHRLWARYGKPACLFRSSSIETQCTLRTYRNCSLQYCTPSCWIANSRPDKRCLFSLTHMTLMNSHYELFLRDNVLLTLWWQQEIHTQNCYEKVSSNFSNGFMVVHIEFEKYS